MGSGLNVSTREFRKIIKEELVDKCEQLGKTYDNESQRGVAFQYWIAELIESFEQGYEPGAEDAVLQSRDLGADIVMEDTERQHLLICQCKCQPYGRPISEIDVSSFFARHEHYCDKEWVEAHGSQYAADLLGEYGEKVDAGFSVTFRFISTGKSTDKLIGTLDHANARYADGGIPVSCELQDFGELKQYYARAKAAEVSTPEEVRIDLPQGRFIQKDEPYRSVIAVVKGNAIRNLYSKWKDSLYAWNIRGYLGNKGINSDISKTARENPGEFFYFNNGISAICTEFELQGKRSTTLIARDFQVINGAQTITSIAKASPDDSLEILFRLTKALSVKTEKGINAKIIRFNNSQNNIRVSDFRSNDPIQKWLEIRFKKQRAKGPVINMHYRRRREVGGGRGIGKGVDLPLLGKIRFSFLEEPTQLHAVPRSLYVRREDEQTGLYDRAFGVESRIEDQWSNETFKEALLAITLYQAIEQRLTHLVKEDPGYQHLKRMRYHILSLCGEFYRLRQRRDGSRPQDFLKSKSAFREFFESFREAAEDAVEDEWSRAAKEDTTVFAFLRNTDRWESIKDVFLKKMKRRLI
ncbi:MAG: AIPR family protein [Thermoanaerobaculia bacterium]|nr:AIPR family protein [Thermoanaerobaculia bacterium]